MQAIQVHIGAWSVTVEMGSLKWTKLEEVSTKLPLGIQPLAQG